MQQCDETLAWKIFAWFQLCTFEDEWTEMHFLSLFAWEPKTEKKSHNHFPDEIKWSQQIVNTPFDICDHLTRGADLFVDNESLDWVKLIAPAITPHYSHK